MAELRSIEKSLDVGILSVTGTILSLADDYVIIPHLLHATRKFDDYVITVIGPNGLFLLSYQPFFNKEKKSSLIEDYIIYLREYAIKLREYLHYRNIKLESPTNLIIVVEQQEPDFEETSDDLLIVPVNQLKNVIVNTKLDKKLSKEKIQEVTKEIRANVTLKRIHQYQLLSEISSTDNSSTYIAYDTTLERTVTVEEIKNYTSLVELEDLEKNEVIRDAKLMMQLTHRNIINIEQIIPKENSLYIIKELFDDAQSLRHIINSSKVGLNPEFVKRIMLQICEALEHAHSKGIVHRYIRPENILLTKENLIKITNFGFAKKKDMVTRSTFDLREMIKENPYAAPEFKLGSEGHHNIDQRVDVYATGIILYELLTNRVPSHLADSYWEPPSQYNTNVTEEFDKIALKALRIDPHQRFATISALKNRLLWLGKTPNTLTSEQRYNQREEFKRTRNSIIYQAFDTKENKKIALKKVILDMKLNQEQRKQKLNKLLTEACIVSKLNHPNIVSVYDYFIEDGDGYIVMEWLEGKTIRDVKNEGLQFDINSIVNIGIQIGEALNYAHQNNIMHKDIKPENIMLSNGKITILDFGLATFLEEKNAERNHGTVMYMAPEQMNQDWVMDQRVDIFSLGVLLYELITEKYPYDIPTILSKYNKVLEPQLPSELNFVCPRNLNLSIMKALKVNPDERYQKISDFIQDLKNIFDQKQNDSYERKNLFIKYFTVTGSFVFLFLSMLLLYSAVSLFKKDRKDITEAPNVVVSVPAIPNEDPEVINNTQKDDTNLENLKRTYLNKKKETNTKYQSNSNILTISNNSGWTSDTTQDKKIFMEATLEVDKTSNKTIIHLVVKNDSEDELEILNRTDDPKVLSIKDDLGNDYTSKVDLLSVSGDLIRVYPHSIAEGSFTMNDIPKSRKLYLMISEYEGKNRVFSLNINKK